MFYFKNSPNTCHVDILLLHLDPIPATVIFIGVYLSFYLKYGIYKPREVKNLITKRVHKHKFLYDASPPEVYKSHVINRMIQ